MDKVLNIIKNDPWLEPYADAINGRHQHVVEKEKELVGKKTLSDLLPDTCILVCTAQTRDGLSVNGRRMRRKSTWWAISTTGRRNRLSA